MLIVQIGTFTIKNSMEGSSPLYHQCCNLIDPGWLIDMGGLSFSEEKGEGANGGRGVKGGTRRRGGREGKL